MMKRYRYNLYAHKGKSFGQDVLMQLTAQNWPKFKLDNKLKHVKTEDLSSAKWRKKYLVAPSNNQYVFSLKFDNKDFIVTKDFQVTKNVSLDFDADYQEIVNKWKVYKMSELANELIKII